MPSIFFGSRETPSLLHMWPKYSTCGANSVHLTGLQVSPAHSRRSNTVSSLSKACSKAASGVSPAAQMAISSK